MRDFPKHAKGWTRSRCNLDVAAREWEPLTSGRHRRGGQWVFFLKNVEAARWYTR